MFPGNGRGTIRKARCVGREICPIAPRATPSCPASSRWSRNPIRARPRGSPPRCRPAKRKAAPIGTIAWQWAGEDPQATSKWAASLPEGASRERAFENLVNRWSQNDPYATGAWLGTLPAGQSRDTAVAAYTRRVASTDPLTAAQWAETIGNDSMRNSQIESIAAAWLKTDANRATAWIANSSLSEDVKARLLPRTR